MAILKEEQLENVSGGDINCEAPYFYGKITKYDINRVQVGGVIETSKTTLQAAFGIIDTACKNILNTEPNIYRVEYLIYYNDEYTQMSGYFWRD